MSKSIDPEAFIALAQYLLSNGQLNTLNMFKSYVRVAFRVFGRNRLITFINVFGLGLAMTVGMMIMIRLQEDLSYDNFHPHPEDIFRIISTYHKKSGETWRMATTPLPLRQPIADN